jgi:hypothetical protein
VTTTVLQLLDEDKEDEEPEELEEEGLYNNGHSQFFQMICMPQPSV